MRAATAYLLAGWAAACASSGAHAAPAAAPAAAATPAPRGATGTAAESLSVNRPQYPSTYQRHPYPPVVISNATIGSVCSRALSR